MLVALPAGAANNWYVRPSSVGSNNGTSWSNAWSISSIAWASIQPGDTVWLAGGTYTTALNSGKAGTAGNPITFKRVLSTDSVPVAAAGWSSAFDSQVYWNMPSTMAITLSHPYITIDGRVGAGAATTAYGIKIKHDSSYYGALNLEAANDIVQYIETEGVGLAVFEQGRGSCSNSVTIGWDSAATNSAIRYNYFHDTDTLIYGNADGLVIEHNTLSRSGGNGSTGSYCHGNIFYLNGTNSTGGIFRYNDLSQYDDEGIILTTYSGAASNWKIYGNVFHDGHTNPYVSNYPRGIEFYSGLVTTGYEIYNNTFANLNLGGIINQGVSSCTSCFVRNNISYNAGIDAIGTQSNNLTSGFSFVNMAGQDYHLSAATSAGYSLSTSLPAGCTVGINCYNLDMDGKTRGADGVWDIGAYQVGTVSSGNPAAPTGLVASVQ
jgi:hypothetical protein